MDRYAAAVQHMSWGDAAESSVFSEKAQQAPTPKPASAAAQALQKKEVTPTHEAAPKGPEAAANKRLDFSAAPSASWNQLTAGAPAAAATAAPAQMTTWRKSWLVPEDTVEGAPVPVDPEARVASLVDQEGAPRAAGVPLDPELDLSRAGLPLMFKTAFSVKRSHAVMVSTDSKPSAAAMAADAASAADDGEMKDEEEEQQGAEAEQQQPADGEPKPRHPAQSPRRKRQKGNLGAGTETARDHALVSDSPVVSMVRAVSSELPFAAVVSPREGAAPDGKPQKQAPPARSSARDRFAQRSKNIALGKATVGYLRYSALVPRASRTAEHPRTPDKTRACSKRAWEGRVKKWRRELHTFDPPAEELAQWEAARRRHLANHPLPSPRLLKSKSMPAGAAVVVPLEAQRPIGPSDN